MITTAGDSSEFVRTRSFVVPRQRRDRDPHHVGIRAQPCPQRSVARRIPTPTWLTKLYKCEEIT
ncbi:hypothetical protein GCM10022225_28310 [Plantactinospora mayteni]|uniref:Uncharacterized protein n=1 Tax=Plantactinospora mayteni TaxID=566021 RepID=A0ABQ4ETB2_9ACTN|nr:hypothetical protein Pma05_44770 [Plantactinospora mayteni]